MRKTIIKSFAPLIVFQLAASFCLADTTFGLYATHFHTERSVQHSVIHLSPNLAGSIRLYTGTTGSVSVPIQPVSTIKDKYNTDQIPRWLIFLTVIISVIVALQLVLNQLLNSKIKAKTRELRVKEKEYRELVEGANTIILRWDKDGIIRFINTYGIKLFGFPKEEIIGRHILDTIIPREGTDGRDLAVMLNDIIQNPAKFALSENENVCKNGQRIHIQWSNRPVHDDEGQFLEMLSFGTDISALKKLESDLFQSRKMEAIGTLAGGIAHDFNNVLSIIWGYAELAHLSSFQYEDIEKYIAQVLLATKRGKDLVGQILAFSRRTESLKQPFNPGPIIKEAMAMIRSTIPATISIEQTVSSEKDIFGDPGQIHQVIINLCTNAYQALESTGGIIGISLMDIILSDENPLCTDKGFVPGPYVRLDIRDSGAGIEKHVLDNIFEPYFTTKGKGKGTGLGLAVVHGIVKDHNGQILVESSPGDGTVFSVYFPASEENPVTESMDMKPIAVRGGNESIILVDDEQSIVGATTSLLAQCGYEVSGFNHARLALDEFKQNPEAFNLMITDMTMPEMTGAQLAEEILQIRPDFPIILCTGFSELIDREKALEIGISEYLQKPVLSGTLLKKVRDLLDRQSPPNVINLRG